MKISEIKEYLCVRDERNPDHMVGEDNKTDDCYCVHCLHGCHKLADALLKSLDEIEELKEELDSCKEDKYNLENDYDDVVSENSDYVRKIEYCESRLSKTDRQFDLIGCILNER